MISGKIQGRKPQFASRSYRSFLLLAVPFHVVIFFVSLYFNPPKMTFITVLDIIGTLAFAVSGALTAMHKKLDVFGIFIIGFVTAIGGGTMRDILIGNTPVIWMEQTYYVYLIGIAVILAILFRKYLGHLSRSLFLFDSIGLGIFTIIGVETGLRHELDPMICVALGAMTGCFGGVIRDTLCNKVPVIFHKEIYATASIAGGLCYLILYKLGANLDLIYLSTACFIIILRLLVVRYSIRLPSFYVGQNVAKEPDEDLF